MVSVCDLMSSSSWIAEPVAGLWGRTSGGEKQDAWSRRAAYTQHNWRQIRPEMLMVASLLRVRLLKRKDAQNQTRAGLPGQHVGADSAPHSLQDKAQGCCET
jgi:hypothetical protein